MADVEHKFHIYRRVKHPKRRDLWYCIEPTCTHRINQMYLVDKVATCPHCTEPFTITARKLRDQSLLHCDNCKTRGPKANRKIAAPTVAEIAESLKELL